MGGVAKRSAFVIDKAGIVRYAEVQEHPKDLPDFEAVKAVLAQALSLRDFRFHQAAGSLPAAFSVTQAAPFNLPSSSGQDPSESSEPSGVKRFVSNQVTLVERRTGSRNLFRAVRHGDLLRNKFRAPVAKSPWIQEPI